MTYKQIYKTGNNFDDILMISDGEYLTGLSFIDSKDVTKYTADCSEKDLIVFRETIKWLDIYFSGKSSEFTPKYKLTNLTPFRQAVIDVLKTIKFGEVLTYKEIANKLVKNKSLKGISAQAVGGAVGWNPICIIIPCHRVIGSDGCLTGYSGGIKNKFLLLTLEKNDMHKYFIPKKGTSL